jgi:alanine dehydrogenase
MGALLVLSRSDVERALTLDTVIAAVEQGFREDPSGANRTYPVVREQVPEHEGIFGIKSGYTVTREVMGLKAGGFWQGNSKQFGLPNHQSVMVLFDPRTGAPTALVDANYITAIRTGAASAVAAKYLSRPDSHTVAMIGAGAQARMQLKALARVREVREVRVFDAFPGASAAYAAEFAGASFAVAAVDSAREALAGADIAITTTPSYSPVVLAEWVPAGIHINAMGADTKGKQELDETLFRRAALIVDNLEQAKVLGETQHAVSKGILTEEQVRAELGEVIAGLKPGRLSPEEITVYDGTGVSFQDLVTAHLAVEVARRERLGTTVTL